jgi:hypothetical protein
MYGLRNPLNGNKDNIFFNEVLEVKIYMAQAIAKGVIRPYRLVLHQRGL